VCSALKTEIRFKPNHAPWARKFLDALGLYVKIYGPAIQQLTLFSILMEMISLQLQAIRKRLLDPFIIDVIHQ
jgi:hypothetical protein